MAQPGSEHLENSWTQELEPAHVESDANGKFMLAVLFCGTAAKSLTCFIQKTQYLLLEWVVTGISLVTVTYQWYFHGEVY